jgi:uncharacterized membrane protein YhaH (DUF805 family)
MSKPVFSDVFTFKGRRNRQSFILFQLASIAAVFLGLGVITAIAIAAPGSIGSLFWALGIIGFIAIAIANWAAASQRIRDFGQSGVWALVILIPYIGPLFSIALWLIPGNQGDNKYGPDQTVAQTVSA